MSDLTPSGNPQFVTQPNERFGRLSSMSVRPPAPETSVEETAAQFCERMWRPLVGTLTVKLGDVETAQELAQEALARSWQRWDEVGAMEAPDRWVFRVALNLSSSWLRRRGAERRAKNRLDAGLTSPPDPRDVIELREAIRTLPKREREVVTLRYYGGLSVRDVAEVLGISDGSVKSAAFDARTRLRRQLDISEEER